MSTRRGSPTQVAKSIPYDNSSSGLSAKDVQAAIDEVSGKAPPLYIQYQYIGNRGYFDYYLFAGYHARNNFNRESGDSSNGYNFSNSAPPLVPGDYQLTQVNLACKGLAQGTGSPASIVNLRLQLRDVGFSGEGPSLGDFDVPIDSTAFTIGNFGNSGGTNTDYKGTHVLSSPITVDENTLLGLKFLFSTANDRVTSIRNITAVLKLEPV